jgi:hypothetical protein
MPSKVLRLLTVAAAVAAVAVDAPSAMADKSLTVGKGSCSIRANSPSLKAGLITSSVTVSCSTSTTVVVEYGVVEMDGITEDARVEVPFQKKSVAVVAGKSVTLPTATVACVSTESSYEELATKTRISAGTAQSAWERTTPASDSYAC